MKGRPCSQVRDQRFKYRAPMGLLPGTDQMPIAGAVPQKEWLFDLEGDRRESYDTSDRNPEKLAQLRAAFEAKEQEMAANKRGWKQGESRGTPLIKAQGLRPTAFHLPHRHRQIYETSGTSLRLAMRIRGLVRNIIWRERPLASIAIYQSTRHVPLPRSFNPVVFEKLFRGLLATTIETEGHYRPPRSRKSDKLLVANHVTIMCTLRVVPTP